MSFFFEFKFITHLSRRTAKLALAYLLGALFGVIAFFITFYAARIGPDGKVENSFFQTALACSSIPVFTYHLHCCIWTRHWSRVLTLWFIFSILNYPLAVYLGSLGANAFTTTHELPYVLFGSPFLVLSVALICSVFFLVIYGIKSIEYLSRPQFIK